MTMIIAAPTESPTTNDNNSANINFATDHVATPAFTVPTPAPTTTERTNLKKHLKQGKQDVEATISAMNFTGPAVIDWENWRPLFNRNFGSKRIYQSSSRKLVKRQHPTWNRTQIIREAKIEFERAAREMMESTLNLGEKLRNEARWGFYGFPRIYRKHLNKTRIGNDR
ncbi:hyaluronidase [Octopus bimaculoides]|uniref:hyaluronidase n=1 Tax=Octopus bimaculoides TaxID=37653 RepID=UPI0022E8377D|nr:hyaluronidase [Octopus bimaculoides]